MTRRLGEWGLGEFPSLKRGVAKFSEKKILAGCF